MPLTDDKKNETRERLTRDPDFREEFLISARNMYKHAMTFNKDLINEIDRFEKILGADPDTYEFEDGETDELDIFEHILDAYDNQLLIDEKNASTIN